MAATLSFFLRPLCISISKFHNKIPIAQLHRPLRSSSSSLSSLCALTFPQTRSLCITNCSNSKSLLEKEVEQDEEQDFDSEFEEFGSNDADDDVGIENDEEGGPVNLGLEVVGDIRTSEVKKVKLPNLTVKEKKELASYAHSLGKKLKSQLVGKSGVTDNVVSSFLETLEANELLKIKIHRTCPGELEDVVEYLEQATGSVVVSQIGRTIIIYRPSLTKMKAEEKKREAQRIFMRRRTRLKPTLMKKGPLPRLSGRGRRGTSKVEY
ncbi:hypothetical protein CCACVL1_16776 [Corchorus capsularis]|uniref:CRM domain-containing protein n=1 Tax=Corchorus capsularis TaxID=210143 RepID=A0A1R3HVI6_COCAP|nr:hypothetical protein CCACVL1_16776 [Corchorus capsularis]